MFLQFKLVEIIRERSACSRSLGQIDRKQIYGRLIVCTDNVV